MWVARVGWGQANTGMRSFSAQLLAFLAIVAGPGGRVAVAPAQRPAGRAAFGRLAAVFGRMVGTARTGRPLPLDTESQQRRLFDGAPLASYLVEPDSGCIVACNAAAAAMLGYDQPTLCTMRLADIETETGDPRPPPGQGGQFETRHRTSAGELRDVLVAAAPVETNTGRLLHCTVVDITARKRTEARLRSTFEEAAVGILHISPGGQVLRVNRYVSTALGYRRHEIIGRSVQDLVLPAQREEVLLQLRRIARGEIDSYSGDRVYLGADGRRVEVAATVSMVHDRLEEPYFLVIAQHISDRRRVEAALQKSERQLRQIFTTSPLGIAVLTARCHRIVQANNAFARVLGTSEAELAGRSLFELLAPGPEIALPAPGAAEAAPTDTRDICMLTRAGRKVWLRMSLTRFEDPGGTTPMVLAITEDITERRVMEAALRQANRLEAIGKLTGGIAHDFNNLLSVITLAAETLADLRDPMVARPAGEIVSAALHGSEMVRRLLAFARKQPLASQAVDLNAVVSDTVNLLERSLGEAIRIELDRAPGLWIAETDPAQVQDAVLNLAINARDAMPRGGVLRIATANLALQAEAARAADLPAGEYVTLTVADTGCGMAPEVLEHALDPFFTTKPHGAGTGMGLSTIYGFARQCGGNLKISSALGEGTQVRLLLPRAAAEAVPGPREGPRLAPPAPAASLRRILVVDDNAALRSVVIRQLVSLGYDVLAAESGPAALDFLQGDAAIDLLFTDEVMPQGLSGTELAEAARRLRPDIKVLLTTGYAPGTAMESRENAPQHPLLAKPYRRSDLAAKVREVLLD
ncbi:Histidine kinase [Rhodovastum atsumiense]|nr:Histidine kinase [Rhodovastum atsumiense]